MKLQNGFKIKKKKKKKKKKNSVKVNWDSKLDF